MNITTVLVLVFAVACRCGEPGGDVGLVADGRFVESGELIRDQLFFVGEEPEKILTAWVFRWRHMPAVAELDAWAFTGHQGEVETFQVGRILVIGDEQDAGGQNWEIMGIEWLQEGSRLMVSIPGMTIQAPSLTNAGQGRDSHGVVSWHSSAATLSRNGRISTGQLVVERLRGTVDEPMGQCETWLFQPGRGGLVLGRQWYGEPTHGEALQMPPDGRAGPTNFTSTIVSTDEKTGIPIEWRLGRGVEMGQLTLERGAVTADDTPPYDVTLAGQNGGDGLALVFHSLDQVDPITAGPSGE